MALQPTRLLGYGQHPQPKIGREKEPLKPRTPIERIFRTVLKREMTPDERRVLLGNPRKVQRSKK